MNVTVNIGERTCTLTIRWLRQNLYIQVFHAQRGNAPRPSMRCYPMRHDQRFWEADLTIIEKLHKAAVAGGAAFGDAITFNEHILYAPDDNMRRNIGDRNSIMQNGCGDKLYMAQDLAYYLLAQGSPIAARSSSGYSKLSPHDVGQYFSEMQWRARVEWESYMMNKQLSSPPKRSSHYPDLAAANKRVTKIPISTIPVSRAPTPAPQKTLPALPSPPTPPMPSLSSRVTTVGPINHYGYEPQVVPAHQNGPPRQDKGTGAMDAESTRSPDTPFQHHEMPARNNRFSGEDPFHWE